MDANRCLGDPYSRLRCDSVGFGRLTHIVYQEEVHEGKREHVTLPCIHDVHLPDDLCVLFGRCTVDYNTLLRRLTRDRGKR